MNRLFYGDNLEVLRRDIPSESVDLVYIDPPFNSKRNYNQLYTNVGKEDKAQAQAFVDTWEWDDRANKGLDEIRGNYNSVFTRQSIGLINGLEPVLGRGSLLAYLVSITLRIAEIHRILKLSGSFYLHCDPTASHYLKLVCDSIFCSRGGDFQNEISWCYKERELSKKRWNRKHDIILFYTKSDNYTFNYKDVMGDYSDYTLKHKFKYKDEKGHYRLRYKDGRNDPKVEGPDTYRQYADIGVLARDWWDISIINQASKERLGYPTQKPEALLEKIIKASSNEGDVILDCYCGCGTSVAVAQKFNRQWIGVDITYQSISLILRRLEFSFGKEVLDGIKIGGIPKDFESAVDLAEKHKKDDRLRKEIEKWAILTYTKNKAMINEKKGGDGGFDGMAYVLDKDEGGKEIYKQVFFSVKSGLDVGVDRVRELFGVVEREGGVRGILLTLYRFEKLVKESKKYGRYKNKFLDMDFGKIDVICVEDILDGLVFDMPTSLDALKKAEFKQKGKQGELGEGG